MKLRQHFTIMHFFLIIYIILGSAFHSYSQTRQRNIIYVLDCTGSMGGYNGAPNIWQPTKNFLKTELNKLSKENSDSKVTILPFQEKVHHPIDVDLYNIAWPKLEKVLDGYVNQLTATNICDSWLEGEKYIDPSRDNYIILLTDGQDNIGGESNKAKRIEQLSQILNNFCGKYPNTKGFYVELTEAATLPNDIRKIIDICKDLYKIDASEGIPSFGCMTEDIIHVNTRDLPVEIPLSFSNSGTFKATLESTSNSFVNFSIREIASVRDN